jgi:PPK2 family polyphosphate:nucleotide phosphotransferase
MNSGDRLGDRFRVPAGESVRLTDHDPDYTGDFPNKKRARRALKQLTRRLIELQYLLYAENARALLIVLQGMDAAGKDGTIRRVMRGMNPQGTTVTSFKQPSAEELDHDFLWRIHKAVPRRGDVGIFNRSHYEDVLVVRVHDLVAQDVWADRYGQINAFEKNLSDEGIVILKFFLHISRDEQKQRFEDRLGDPTRHWKISPADFSERPFWDRYTEAYEAALAGCSTEWAPWYIIPANRKWFRDLAVAQIIADRLESLDMKFPAPVVDISQIRIE